jgi:hypothetical protein
MKGFNERTSSIPFLFSILTLGFLLNASLEGLAQNPIKESPFVELSSDVWQIFHDQESVNFSGKLGQCDGKPIAIIKFTNRTPNRTEVRVSTQNGSKRLGLQVIRLQPNQEVVIECRGQMGFQPLVLVDGNNLRIETQVTHLK